MRIEKIETMYVDRYLYLKMYTDTGLVGLGEAGCWGYLGACEAVIREWEPALIGADTKRIEYLWQYLYRNAHFRGSAVCGALGAIDAALWDIKGKHYETPVYELLGGRVRNKIRVQRHVNDTDLDALVAHAKQEIARGVTALRIIPFAPNQAEMRHDARIKEAVRRLSAVREAVGDGVDLSIELGRHLSPAEAITFASELECARPIYYEDPSVPDSIQACAEVARAIRLPVATGERLTNIFEFRELLESGGARYIRLDLGLAGGLTPGKKIAALAEAYSAGVVPHGGLSTVSTWVAVHLDATIPNFVFQDYVRDEDAPTDDLLVENLKLENGYLVIPEKPGIGAELKPDIDKKYPRIKRPIQTALREDGSVAFR
jgi:galactonate dehydratase